jgi:hypothetical protein
MARHSPTSRVPGDRHVFVRYLNSQTPVILTRASDDWYVAGWSPDERRVIARGKNPAGGRYALFSVPVFGGDPALLMSRDKPRMPFPRVSSDGKVLAGPGLTDGKLSVYTSSPVGSALQRYTPAPFETTASFNAPMAMFDPDERSITFVMDVVGGRQAWKLPYPAGSGLPERIMKSLNIKNAQARIARHLERLILGEPAWRVSQANSFNSNWLEDAIPSYSVDA